MRRNFLLFALIAAAVGFQACAADSPAPSQNNGNGGGNSGNAALQVRLFTNNANPTVGLCSTIQAIATLSGGAVPDGTSIIFSTDLGTFQQNGQSLVAVVANGGTATTAVCSDTVGVAKVKAAVTVGLATATSSLNISFQPSTQSVPFFAFCSPNSGPNAGGTALTITGGRFFGDATSTRVQFTVFGVTHEGLVQAVTATTVTVLTPAFLEATSPSVPVDITVTFGTNTGAPVTLAVPNCFVYGTAVGTPTITAILPSSGSNNGGTRVTIIGAGFVAPVQVFFGPVEAAPPISVTYNQIVVLAPPASGAGAPNLNQTVAVRVHEVASGVDSNTNLTYRFTPPVQIISFDGNNVQDINGPFTPVTIFGQGFEAPVKVSLAGFVATVMSVSATEISVLPGGATPTGCADVTGPMTVTNINTGDSASGQVFFYSVKSAGPVIGSVSATDNLGNVSATITGANFTGVTSVTLGGKAAGFSVVNSQLIVATASGIPVPACPSGSPAGTLISAGDVVVTNRFGCSATATGALALACQ